MSRRVYVPLRSTELAELVAEGRLPGPRTAYAVTERLRAALPDADQEEWEYVAMAAAADGSWQRRGTGEPPRRHVVAADVGAVEEAGGEEGTDEHPAAVVLPHDVVWRNVASAHVDTADVTAADVEDDTAPDLAWFATQEMATLV